ncbi:MAG: oligosaccharide flippase family protein [Roseivivax sp.]|nr:oligosaccharide flippase family protein [Roseivivax sp.]
MNAILAKLRGGSLTARIWRSSFLTVGGFGFSQVLRLASNLILTRLLYPEAFGLMALISVFMMGLAMFSDVGVHPAIMQSKRGDDPDFLNTAWTIQVVRGFGLWLTACALAYPMALIYGDSRLFLFIPVASFSLVIAGFDPTKMATANRHLNLGRVTLLDMVTQVAGIAFAVVFAYIYHSIWALVLSGIFSTLVQLVINTRYLPGANNRFHWEKAAAHELIHFGKWIFLSTIAGFLIQQGDKIILGKYLILKNFGIYNIAFFLASFPLMLGNMVTSKILIPIYRETPPKNSPANFAKLRKMRTLVTGALLVMVGVFALMGSWLIDMMYDERYADAGPMVTLIAVMQIPHIIVLTYDQAALAAGDSKRFFVLAASRAFFTLATLVIGLEIAGLLGGIVARGASVLLVYPVVVWLSRKTGAWDKTHDALFALFGLLVGACALWIHWEDIGLLSHMGLGL